MLMDAAVTQPRTWNPCYVRQEHHLEFLYLGFCICGMETGAIYLAEGTPHTMDLSLKLELTESTRPAGQKSRGARPYPCRLGCSPLP
ncbi:hypothetical protein LEMLEM_LOCUS20423 [Lemmus lemmus]